MSAEYREHYSHSLQGSKWSGSGEAYFTQPTNRITDFNMVGSSHQSQDSAIDGIQCKFCPMTFSRPALYTLHIASLHPYALPFMCSLCKKGFHTKTGYKLHMQAHNGRTFACPACQATFKLKHHLKRHLEMVHKLSQCNKCQAVFDKQADYNVHLASCS